MKRKCVVQVLFDLHVCNYRSGPGRFTFPLIDKQTFPLVFLTERSFCHRQNPTHIIVHDNSMHVRVFPMNSFFLSLPTCKKTLLLSRDISQLVKIRSQQFRLITTINEQNPHGKLAKTYPFNKVRPIQLLVRRAKRDEQSATELNPAHLRRKAEPKKRQLTEHHHPPSP